MIRFRQAVPSDEALIAQDPDHQADPMFWLKMGAGVETFVVEDDGGPVMFARIENVRRIHLNFPPHVSAFARAKALAKGLDMVVEKSKGRCVELLFESASPRLVKFMEKLGFKKLDNQYGAKI